MIDSFCKVEWFFLWQVLLDCSFAIFSSMHSESLLFHCVGNASAFFITPWSYAFINTFKKSAINLSMSILHYSKSYFRSNRIFQIVDYCWNNNVKIIKDGKNIYQYNCLVAESNITKIFRTLLILFWWFLFKKIGLDWDQSINCYCKYLNVVEVVLIYHQYYM